MSEPRLNHVSCLGGRALHRMAYWEWGDPANPSVVVCAHGVSRQGRDFDALATSLRKEHRVICPDFAGRGQSDWLSDAAGYQIPQYVSDSVALIARLNVPSVQWVGTSMGGLIGLALGALKNSPIRRLVLNDIGPTLDAAALVRIGGYLGLPARWASVDEAADALRAISLGFGQHSRETWLALTRPMLKKDGDAWIPHYDPRIGEAFRGATSDAAKAGEAALWAMYDALPCPTLLLRGANSDLLSRTTAEEMTQRGPRARLHEFADVGHAPMLNSESQMTVVREFLAAPA